MAATKRMTSQLVVELLDRVTGPARRVSEAITGIRRTADRGAPASFSDRLNASLNRTNARLAEARSGVLDAVGAFYALKGAIGAPVQSAMALESAMADVKKVVDFNGAEDVKAFEAALLDLTRTVPMTVEGLAQIAAAAGQAGIAKDDIIPFTEAAAKIGVAFGISADEAGTAMAKMMTGLGMTLPEVVSLSDAINHLSNSQASNAAEVLDVVRRTGAMGKQYGFTAEQVAAFGSAMIASGAQSDVAATSFMNMGRALTRGASATKRQREAYAALGMDAKKVAAAMQKDAVKTTITVMEAIAALPKEQQAAISSDLFGDEARALGPLLTRLELVRESVGMVGDQSKYAGSAFKEFEVRAKTFENRLQRFRSAITRVSIAIGNALLPVLTDMMNALEPILDRVAEWTAANPKLVAGILAAVSAAIALKGALAALRFVGLLGRSGALSAIAIGMNTIGAAAGRLWGAAKAAVGLQAALGAMSGGQALTTLQKLGVGLRAAIGAIPGVGALSATLGWLGGALTAVGTALAGVSAPVWAGIAIGVAAVAAAGAALYRYWDRITSVLSGVAARIGEELAPALAKLQPIIDAAKPALAWLAGIGSVIGDAWDGAKAKLAAFWDWLGGLFQREVLTEDQMAAWEKSGYDMTDRMITGLKSGIGRLVQMGRDLIQSLWDGALEKLDELLAWFRELPNRIIEAIGNIDLSNIIKWPSMPAWLGGGAANSNTNPADEFAGVDGARAKGGPIRRGLTYLTGEDGPELITPERDGYVHTAEETRRMMQGGDGGPMAAAAPPMAPEPQAVPAAAPMAPVTRDIRLDLGGVTIHAAPGMDVREVAAEVVRQVESKIGAALRGVQADVGLEAY